MLDAVLEGEDEKYNVNTSIGIIFFYKTYIRIRKLNRAMYM